MTKTIIKKILNEISVALQEHFEENNFFSCVYGSYINGDYDHNSDIDLFVAVKSPSKKDFIFIKKLIVDIHKKYKLSLDAEVPYENKLIISYLGVNEAVYLGGFDINKNGFLKIPKIIKTKEFLSSIQIKHRLIFNALTSPHIFLCGDRKKYLFYKNIAEKNIFLLSLLLNNNKSFVLNDILDKLFESKDGYSGEMYLGYKRYDSIILKLKNILHKQTNLLIAKNLIIKEANNYFLLKKNTIFTNLYKNYRYFKSSRHLKPEKYSWLKLVGHEKTENYLPPNYYDKILKDYNFNGRSDLEIFSDFIRKNLKINKELDILELGGGSGRSTKIFLENFSNINLFEIVDLSTKMIKFSKQLFKNRNINFIKSDTINYLLNTKNKYDFVFSLWNLSHSIHQHLLTRGIFSGSAYVTRVLNKFISNNLKPGGIFFIIHYDTLSEEQKLVAPYRVNLWNNVYSGYDISKQSPSKQLIDEILNNLALENIISRKIYHLKGDPIKYSSLEEVLEIFMNFHMEGNFNNSKNVQSIIKDLSTRLKKYQKGNNFFIPSGCFIYVIKKIN